MTVAVTHLDECNRNDMTVEDVVKYSIIWCVFVMVCVHFTACMTDLGCLTLLFCMSFYDEMLILSEYLLFHTRTNDKTHQHTHKLYAETHLNVNAKQQHKRTIGMCDVFVCCVNVVRLSIYK